METTNHMPQRTDPVLDYLVSARQQRLRNRKAERSGVLRLMASSNLVGCNTGRSAGFAFLRMRPV
jgi:hypothetical protein